MAVTVHGDDQQYLVGKETVTLRSTHRDGAEEVTAEITSAVRYPVTLREVQASYGAYQAGDVNWTVGASTLGDVAAPKPGDTVTDAGGEVFTVLEAKKGAASGFYVLVTRNLAVASALHDECDVELPTVTHDAAVGRSEVWAASVSGLRCRFQPTRTAEFDERDVRSTQTEYDVIVASDVTPTNEAGDWGRLVKGGVYYEIVGYEQAERIDALPIIKVRKVP